MSVAKRTTTRYRAIIIHESGGEPIRVYPRRGRWQASFGSRAAAIRACERTGFPGRAIIYPATVACYADLAADPAAWAAATYTVRL